MTEQTAWEKYKASLGDTRPWDIINPKTVWTSDELFDKRYSICKQCPELIKISNQCKKCGCFMTTKAKIENAKCPLGKW